MGSVFTRSNGSFTARVRMQGHPEQAETFGSRREATRWMADTEAAMRAGSFQRTASPSVTLGDAIEKWADANRDILAHFDVEESRIRTLKTFVIDLGTKVRGQELRGKIVDIAVARLDVDHIENLIDWMEESEYAGRTIGQYLSIIQRSWAKSMRRPVATCPTAAAQNRPKVGEKRKRRFEDDEETRLIVASSQAFRAVVKFALGTCARQSEIADLTWRDLNLFQSTALLKNTKNGESRTLPLSFEMTDLLAELHRREPHDRIFGMTREAIKRRMIRATTRAGIENLHFHDLRHEAISRLFEFTDLTDMEIMSISGHKSVQMLRDYTHLRANNLVGRVNGARRGRSIRDDQVRQPQACSSLEKQCSATPFRSTPADTMDATPGRSSRKPVDK